MSEKPELNTTPWDIVRKWGSHSERNMYIVMVGIWASFALVLGAAGILVWEFVI